MSDRLLDQARIIELLTELGRRLDVRGVRAEFFVVGGAAMALACSSRRTTVDIDTAAEVLAVAEQVRARRPDRLTPKVRFLVEELFAGPLSPGDPA